MKKHPAHRSRYTGPVPNGISSAELADLRRIAYQQAPAELARIVADLGLPTDLVNLRQASQIAGVTRSSVRRLINGGRLPAYRVGRRILVPLGQLIRRGIGSQY